MATILTVWVIAIGFLAGTTIYSAFVSFGPFQAAQYILIPLFSLCLTIAFLLAPRDED
jgi:hypothetical protein